jgi:PAS domain S-box-containing protein
MMRRSSISEEHLAIVDELVRLEEQSLEGTLDPSKTERWRSLTERLFGPSDYSERRHHFRINTQRHARIVDAEREISAEVTSLSAGGLFLSTEAASRDLVGRDLEVLVDFPRISQRSLRFHVQVCWVAPSPSAPGMGVRFVDLDDEQRRLILDHLRSHLVQMLDLSREKYNFFFQHSSDVAMLLDSEGTVVEVSEATERFLDAPATQLVERPITAQLVGCEDAMRVALEQVRRRERAQVMLTLRSASGEELPVAAVLTPFHVRDLKLGSMLVAHDLRAQRRAQEQQRTMERRLFQADKLATIGQITASIAHDINNPLAYVMTNVTMLQEYVAPLRVLIGRALGTAMGGPVDRDQLEQLDADLESLISECLEGCRRIRDILVDVRAFAAMDGQSEVRTDINQALDASLRIAKNLIQHRARLERDYAQELPPTQINFSRASQVFLNLLTNAAQSFERQDMEHNLIRLSTRLVDGRLEVRIADNGRGIAAEIRELIFEPFFTTRREVGGTGLGLAIVRECIDALDGTLALESEVGRGTCFILTFPVRSGSSPALAAIKDVPGVRRRVLLIDDDVALLRSLERALDRYFEVTCAASGARALALLEQHPFDVILCDVMMPEMNGLVFRERVVERFPQLARMIIFMTGGTFTPEEQRRLTSTSNRVLTKPLDIPVLISTLS